MITLPSITEIDLRNKRVLIRADFNVPIVQDRIINDRRIQATLPTIEYALSQQAAVILLSHRGRPNLEASVDEFSLEPIAHHLSHHLNQPVRFIKEWINGVDINPGEVVLCENVRLQHGEITNDTKLAKKITELADIFVMDAFAVAHRTEASTVGAIQAAQTVCAGLLFLSELENLIPFKDPQRPFIALIGGAKTSTKLKEIKGWIQHVDSLLLGGELANAFLKAKKELKNSIYTSERAEMTEYILSLISDYSSKIHLPRDVIISNINDEDKAIFSTKAVRDVQPEEKITDIGPLTISDYTQIINKAETIFWNGPMGIFEKPSFQEGTKMIAQAISESSAFSIAGGGETLMAIDQWQLYPTCLSTGGGALLDYLAGKPLPAIQALQDRASAGFY